VNNQLDNMFDLYEKDKDKFKIKYIEKSKEPFQFYSCFVSLYKFIKEEKEIKTPILFDASCSGIQHLSALTKDIEIAKLVNLLDDENPNDFYNYCIDLVIKFIVDNISLDNEDNANVYIKEINLNISNTLLKKLNLLKYHRT
jgi:DNA-directed RNA polymerase